MKKIFPIFLIAFLILPIAIGLSACGNPTDAPYIKSTRQRWVGNSVYQSFTIVNPTDKTYMVTVYAIRSWKVVTAKNGSMKLWQKRSDEDTRVYTLGPREEKTDEITASFSTTDSKDFKYDFKGIKSASVQYT